MDLQHHFIHHHIHHHMGLCHALRLCGPGAHGGTQCGCEASSGPYERLSTSPASQLELSALEIEPEDKDAATEKEESLTFHTDCGRIQRVVVERHLIASSLCQVLAVKFSVTPSNGPWTLVEHWPDLGIERVVEDHEQVLAVHRDAGRYANRKFIFRKDAKKYKFFENPRDFFPTDMVDLRGWEQCPEKEIDSNLPAQAPGMDWTPLVFSYVWVRERGRRSTAWSKAFLMLRGDKLYLCHKFQAMARFVRGWRSAKDNAILEKEKEKCYQHGSDSCISKSVNSTVLALSSTQLQTEDPELKLLANLTDYNVYTTLNARNQLRAPTEFGLCLQPCAPSSPSSSPPSTPTVGDDMLCLAVESERTRLCWVTAMRLAKYGKQLCENYRLLRNSQGDNLGSSADCGGSSSSLLSQEHVRARVAMDFTGSVGRIVDDPNEALAVAEAEGDSWRRRWRPPVPRPSSSGMASSSPYNTSTAHLAQAWFLGNLSREQAASLLSRPGTIDGVFVVRESRSVVGSYVLSLRSGGKVLHTQIHPVHDAARGALCFSLDGGATKFFDLLQLVEFYQLNSGCLPTRLLHSPDSANAAPAAHASSF